MALQVGELFASVELEQDGFDQGVDQVESKLGALGGFVTTALAGAVAAGMAAIGAAIVGGITTADEYKKALNGLSVQTGTTGKELEGMGESMKNIYANNFGESFQQIGETMAYVKSATGLAGKELEAMTQNAFLLSDSFGYDINESVRSADKLMKQFGMSGDEAMALIAEGTQKGLNYADDLLPTIDEYSVYFKEAGYSASEMFGLFENAKSAGVFNLDYAADAIKEFGIRMTEDGGAAVETLDRIGLNGKQLTADFAAGGEGAKKALQTITQKLGGMKNEQEQYTAGVELFGTKWEDVGSEGMVAITTLNDGIKGSVETLNQMNAVKYDSFGEAMTGIGRQLQVGLLMPIGEKLLPLLNQFAQFIQANIPAIVGAFSAFGSQVSAMFDGLSSKLEGSGVSFETLKQFWINGFQTIWNVVSPLVQMIGDKVMQIVSMIVAWWNQNGAELVANFQIVFNAIWAVVQKVMPLIMAIVSMVMNNVMGVVRGALNIIGGAFKIFAGLLSGDWGKLWDGVKQVLGGALEFLWNLWNLLLVGRLLSGLKMLGSKIGSLWSSAWNGVKNLFGKFVSWLQSSASNMASGLVSKITGMYNQARSIFTFLKGFGESTFRALWNTIKSVASNIYNSVKSSFTNMYTSVKSTFSNIVSTAKSIFNNVKTAITSPIESAKRTVTGVIDSIKSAFSRMNIRIPKIKLPHIVAGSKTLFGGKGGIPAISVPTFSVDWFKTGGIATGPAIAGIGEAGSEAIVPMAGRRMKPFSEGIAKDLVDLLGGSVGNKGGDGTVVKLYINDKEFAKATTKAITEEQERIKESEQRGRGKRRT